jgi:predicted PurR-regulated permease PerM
MPQKPRPHHSAALRDRSFLLLLALVTLAFGWILLPFYGAVLWGTATAIVFAPLHKTLMQRFRWGQTLSAIATLTLILLLVMLPLAVVSALLVQEAAALYELLKTGQISFSAYVSQVYAVLPEWALHLLSRMGISDPVVLQQKAGGLLAQLGQALAGKAYGFGQDTLDFVVGFFVMLYLLFFLLRDGPRITGLLRDALPLPDEYKSRLGEKFSAVIRATVKGNIAVAALQGALGGLAFWVLDVHAPVLWAVVMAFLSLLPAVGAGLVWVPVAIYLFATGETGAAIGLVAYGAFVIGLVDNLVRPLLVGKDTKLPDYLVLISTLGGMAVFGINGFVIGPLIAAMFVAAWNIVATERPQQAASPQKSDD